MSNQNLTSAELDELERRQRAFRDYSLAEERFGTSSAAQANEDAYDDYREAIDELAPRLIAAARRSLEQDELLHKHGPALLRILDMATSSPGFAKDFGGTDGDEREAAEALRALLKETPNAG